MTKKKTVFAMVLALLLFSGCGTAPTVAAPTETAASVSTETPETAVVLAVNRDASLDPYDCTDICNRFLFDFVYEPLFVTAADGELLPVLAKDWSVSEDGCTTTVTLRDAVFHDGEPLTGADVVYSVGRAVNSAYYGSRFSCLANTEAEGNRVIFTTDQPMECFPRLLDIPISREGSPMNGTGAYAYADTKLLLAQKERELPATIALSPVTSAEGLRDGFQYGAVTVMLMDPNGDDAPVLHGDFEQWTAPTTTLQYIGFSGHFPANLRSALTYAVDRQTIFAELLQGCGVATCDGALPDSPRYFPELSVAYAPEKLKNAVDGRAEYTMIVNRANPQRLATAQRLAAAWYDCGLRITVNPLSPQAYAEALTNGSFDLYYGEIRLPPDGDPTPIFEKNYGGFGGSETVLNLCRAARENSGYAYDLQNAILTDGLLCPIGYRSFVVCGRRGLDLPITPNLNGWVLCDPPRTAAES